MGRVVCDAVHLTSLKLPTDPHLAPACQINPVTQGGIKDGAVKSGNRVDVAQRKFVGSTVGHTNSKANERTVTS